ncbi:MAG: zinc ribbon domain-containing protein [Coriobacteriales bacterium]|jgi:predicted  nucleic acid-binding Zn-ribbon protein
MSDARALIKLQEIDLTRLRLARRSEEMPELQALKQILGKIDEVSEKSKQISALRSNAELEMQQLVDEDADLVEKAAGIEAEIEQSADYRLVQSLTLELEGVAKRRNKVEFDHGKLAERIEKISAVEDQVADANSKLEAKRAALEEKISAETDEINASLASLAEEREGIASSLPADIMAEYDRLCESKNGIAVGVLQDGHCSACRVEFPEGKLVGLQAGPEVATCPQCHRILIVER